MNVPYKFSESGSAILVHDSRVHDVRLRLAAQGLPRGGAVGFELMEAQKFGVSQFTEQVNYQRGLEGELSRTIQSIAAVQAARVHLAIPKPSVFMREELKPSASVLLNLYPGCSLEPRQIAGIQNLVAASVPQLSAAGVTLLDQSGALLSQSKSRLLEAGLDPTQIKCGADEEAPVLCEALAEQFIRKVVRGEIDHGVALWESGGKIVAHVDGGGDGDFLRFSGTEESLAHAAFASSDEERGQL